MNSNFYYNENEGPNIRLDGWQYCFLFARPRLQISAQRRTVTTDIFSVISQFLQTNASN
jgi:hypothetical protein